MTTSQTPIWELVEPEYLKLLAEWEQIVQEMEESLNQGIDWLSQIGAPWPPPE